MPTLGITPLPVPKTDALVIDEGPLQHESDNEFHDLDDPPREMLEPLEPSEPLEPLGRPKRSTMKTVNYKDLHKGKITKDLMIGQLYLGFVVVNTFVP